MDNSNQRLNEVFFYGLYMDEDILKSKNVIPRNKRVAVADGYRLRIGEMATLLRNENMKAHGMVYSLTHDEIDALYVKAGLNEYVVESILVELNNGLKIAALCCNLLNPPENDESNLKYYAKLEKCMTKYALPLPSNV